MTPPQPEYIITEDFVVGVERILSAHGLVAAGEELGEALRSRPAPAPLCDSTDIPTQNEFIAEFVGSAERKRKEHDARIAAQARKDILDKLQYGGMFKMTEEIDRAIQSLREAQR